MPNFKDSQSATMPLLIASIVSLVPALINAVIALQDFKLGGMLYAWVALVTSLLCAYIYFRLSRSIKNGTVSGDWDVLTRYILAMSMIIIVSGVADIFDNQADNVPTVSSSVAGILTIAFGLVVFWLYKVTVDSKADRLSRTVYHILFAMFVCSVIISLVLVILAVNDGDASLIFSRCGNTINKVMIATIMLNIMKRDEVKGRMIGDRP